MSATSEVGMGETTAINGACGQCGGSFEFRGWNVTYTTYGVKRCARCAGVADSLKLPLPPERAAHIAGLREAEDLIFEYARGDVEPVIAALRARISELEATP